MMIKTITTTTTATITPTLELLSSDEDENVGEFKDAVAFLVAVDLTLVKVVLVVMIVKDEILSTWNPINLKYVSSNNINVAIWLQCTICNTVWLAPNFGGMPCLDFVIQSYF